METIFDRVRMLIMDELEREESEITPSASFVDDFNADSLDLAELILAFQEAFDLEIPEKDAGKIKTVQDVVDYLNGRGITDA